MFGIFNENFSILAKIEQKQRTLFMKMCLCVWALSMTGPHMWGSVLCRLCTEGEGTIVVIKTDCVLCEVRTEVEESVHHRARSDEKWSKCKCCRLQISGKNYLDDVRMENVCKYGECSWGMWKCSVFILKYSFENNRANGPEALRTADAPWLLLAYFFWDVTPRNLIDM
jgi:hypothetical protein